MLRATRQPERTTEPYVLFWIACSDVGLAARGQHTTDLGEVKKHGDHREQVDGWIERGVRSREGGGARARSDLKRGSSSSEFEPSWAPWCAQLGSAARRRRVRRRTRARSRHSAPSTHGCAGAWCHAGRDRSPLPTSGSSRSRRSRVPRARPSSRSQNLLRAHRGVAEGTATRLRVEAAKAAGSSRRRRDGPRRARVRATRAEHDGGPARRVLHAPPSICDARKCQGLHHMVHVANAGIARRRRPELDVRRPRRACRRRPLS